MEMMCTIASALAIGSAILAMIAYWRSGGQQDVTELRAELARELEALQVRRYTAADELARRLRGDHEDTLTRIRRAEARLAELRLEMAAEARSSIDTLRTQLAETRRDVELRLERLKIEVSSHAETAERTLRRRVLRLEGRVQIVMARAEMVRAERVAAKRDFVHAQLLLEAAVSRVREVKMRLGEGFDEDPAFDDVIVALQQAIHSVRADAADDELQLEHVVAAGDCLLASLAAHERNLV